MTFWSNCNTSGVTRVFPIGISFSPAGASTVILDTSVPKMTSTGPLVLPSAPNYNANVISEFG